MSSIPKKFFVTSGKAVSPTSPLNAFDLALMKAGIAQCNLVSVSSILPANAEQVPNERIAPGNITFCVMAHMEGSDGETVGSGLGWAFGKSRYGEKYGIVAEAHGHKDGKSIAKELKWKLEEMATVRGMSIDNINLEVKSMRIPKGFYGSVIVTLVYLPE
jgi:arginine decarboxylase